MQLPLALQRLTTMAGQDRVVFTTEDLSNLFFEDKPRTFQGTLKRLLSAGLLLRVTHGIYVYKHHTQTHERILALVAVALRRYQFSYVSLESALSLHDRISQMPIDRITVMTTGRSGEVSTPYGVIEFTHTAQSPAAFLDDLIETNSVLPLANEARALRDLRRVGRNTHMITGAEAA